MSLKYLRVRKESVAIWNDDEGMLEAYVNNASSTNRV